MAKPPRAIVRLFPNVTSMQEARKPVAIEVTTKDVRKGSKGKHAACAMANALCREWGVDKAVVGITYSYVVRGNTVIKFKTPDTVVREIVSFDRTKKFAPGDYHLGPVAPAARQKQVAADNKARRKSHKGGSNKRPKRKVFHAETINVRGRVPE